MLDVTQSSRKVTQMASPASRTAPTVSAGTISYILFSVHFIDASGDKRSISIEAAADTTYAEFEAYALDLQTVSNASIWRIDRSEVFDSNPLASSADPAEENSVSDNVVILQRDSITFESQQFYIPAPIRGLFVGDTDNIDVTDTDFVDHLTKIHNLLATTYAAVSVRYTERRAQNQKQNL